ncbi:hypothetical protein ETAA1_59670 [Urbifossiella limnaea]|uniref:Uncharacterized protein n=1 Tax=Urbifossiella limnaea TaxID=2528023 RepID=A0A517Y2E2_9BACT|nr:hypothetical protein ETAA1_59670 [Urbifossiella limnaea]
MANEVLAKVVCHNVVCCIHADHELRIDVGVRRGEAGRTGQRRRAVAHSVSGGVIQG